jgi:hypothetical protein
LVDTALQQTAQLSPLIGFLGMSNRPLSVLTTPDTQVSHQKINDTKAEEFRRKA